MTGWRILAGLIVTLGGAAAAQAQAVALKEAPLTGCYFHVKMHLSLTGQLKIQQEGKVNPLQQKASADHDFVERILEADEAGPAHKVARLYKAARAQIATAGQESKRSLRTERSLVVAQCYKDQPLTFALKGTLTREELDLLGHLDTLHLAGLLPGKEVGPGDSWKVANETVQALCAFEGLTAHDLAGKLDAVTDGKATVTLAGTASGIDQGAAVTLKVVGRCTVDLDKKRITALEWKQHDERDQGPVSPASEADLTITLTREPVEPLNELNDVILTGLLPAEQSPPETATALTHRDGKGRYDLTCGRDWQTVACTDDYLVLRLLDRGDFVAQATLTWWKKAAEGKHLSEDEFKEAMSGAPGWEQEKLIDAKVVEAPAGHWLYRIEAAGRLNGLSTLQYFYLLAGPRGEQVVIAFTLTPAQAQKLGSRDLSLVQGVAFPEP